MAASREQSMVDGWGSGLGVVGRRGAAVAAAALALVAHGGAALADDSLPSVPTPVGTLVVGETPDGLAVGFTGAGPAQDLGPFGAVLDPGPATLYAPSGPPAPPAPRPNAAIDRDVSTLASCALAAGGCAGAGSTRLAWDLLPLVLGTPADLLPPDEGQAPPCPSADPCAPIGPTPAPRRLVPLGGQLAGIAPALDAVAVAFGPPMTAGLDVPTVPAAPAAAAPPAAAVPAASPGPALASTGTPIVAALAGLVLLAVGGFLTWARARD